MPKSFTNSQSVDKHEDGSYTVTTVETIEPLSTADKAKAWGTLIALAGLAVAPAVAPSLVTRWEERRERKEQEKLAKQQNKD